jgi:hypothetical protein
MYTGEKYAKKNKNRFTHDASVVLAALILSALCLAWSGGSAFAVVVLEDDFTDPTGPMVSGSDSLQVPPLATWYLSSANNANYDGVSSLAIDQIIGTSISWQPNFASSTSAGLIGTVFMVSGTEYAYVMIFTSPPSGGMSIGLTNQNAGFGGPSNRFLRTAGGTGAIYLTNQGTWDTPTNGMDTGGTFIPDVPQGLMMRITDTGAENVKIYYQNGGDKDPTSPAWTELTGGLNQIPEPSDPLRTMDYDRVTITGGHNNWGDETNADFLLDYIALHEDPGPLVVLPPNNVDASWVLY